MSTQIMIKYRVGIIEKKLSESVAYIKKQAKKHGVKL